MKLASKGIVAYTSTQQAREHYGVSLPALVRKPDQYIQTVVPGSNEARWVPAPDAVLTRQAWAASADA